MGEMWNKDSIQWSKTKYYLASSSESCLSILWLTINIDLIKIKLNGWWEVSDIVVLKLILSEKIALIKISWGHQSWLIILILTDSTK